MKKLIAESTSEDLREKSWKMQDYRYDGDILIQNYTTKEGKKLEIHTKFHTYEDGCGNKQIMFQEIYEI